ncbi:hypothetical protein [Polaribacter uvawellassae]|uniref:hypothetical protein n=1 Tax=Polaribacter uvawellassae TaxID=3133495 RepID=UPI00321A62DD
MKPSQDTLLAFYQSLGKLFYAIAASDKHVEEIEFKVLKETVINKWTKIDLINDDFYSDAAFQIEIVFDWLYNTLPKAETCFDAFLDFKTEHPSLFTPKIKELILETSNKIAASFAGLNKSELMMLAKLSIELKK